MVLRILKLVVSALFFIWRGLLVPLGALLKRPLLEPLVVLMYHAVTPAQRARFEWHMDLLLRTGVPVRADHAGPWLFGRPSIAITFDDGFMSVCENALPVLEERNLPATCFIPVGYLGRPPGWISHPDHEFSSEMVLTENDLRKLPVRLITIASHGFTHARLADVGPEQTWTELTKSKQLLEKILGRPITQLALPYGSYDGTVIALAQKAGYERIFLNVPTFRFSASRNSVVGRIEISPADWPLECRLKMAGAYQWLPIAMSLKWGLIRLLGRPSRNSP